MTTLPRQPISIIGGGLSGLALGILLRRHDINVELFESHPYPHHRVCGEFISGIRPELTRALGIDDLLHGAHRHDQTSWHGADGEVFYRFKLRRPAVGISRHTLDQRLALRFCELGGNLIQHRWREYDRHEKVIYATGRRHHSHKAKPEWIGLKLHARQFSSDSHLEMHLGHGGYVGASAVEDGLTNLCGLFPVSAFRGDGARKDFESGLRALGLNHLLSRLNRCERIGDSRCGTMHFHPGYQNQNLSSHPGKCDLGDAMMQIPPFTGHGMTMALEAAWLAHTHVVAYVAGETDWRGMVRTIRDTIRKRHATRVNIACAIHPFLTQGRLPRYWKFLGFLLDPLPPRIAPVLWGGEARLDPL